MLLVHCAEALASPGGDMAAQGTCPVLSVRDSRGAPLLGPCPVCGAGGPQAHKQAPCWCPWLQGGWCILPDLPSAWWVPGTETSSHPCPANGLLTALWPHSPDINSFGGFGVGFGPGSWAQGLLSKPGWWHQALYHHWASVHKWCFSLCSCLFCISVKCPSQESHQTGAGAMCKEGLVEDIPCLEGDRVFIWGQTGEVSQPWSAQEKKSEGLSVWRSEGNLASTALFASENDSLPWLRQALELEKRRRAVAREK